MEIPTFIKQILHPFKTLKSFNTPPCTECEHCYIGVYERSWYCTCPKAVTHRSISACYSYKEVSSEYIRGTSLCSFKQKDKE